MPTYQVTDPETGVKLKLTGDSPPTEAELEEIFAQHSAKAPAVQDDSQIEVIEPMATILSGAAAEPIAGVAGIIQALNPAADEGAGARAVEATREALTFQPRTEAGQESLQAVADFAEPVTTAFNEAEKFLGDTTFEKTGSPVLAASAASIPTALAEILGVAVGKNIVKGSQATKRGIQQDIINKNLTGSAPTVDQLKTASREVFKEIDNLGISLQPKAYNGLVNKLNKTVFGQGGDADITPKAMKALARFNELSGDSPTLTEIDTLRKVAQKAAQSTEPAEASLGVAMIDAVDDFLDNVRPTALKGTKDIEIGKRYQVARDLWGRARKSELIGESFEKARLQASGFENGLRTQFRAILNNKKKRKFFKKDELTSMKRVVEGSKKENIARLIGKLGFTDGASTQLVGGGIGVAGGVAIGGPVGGIAVPMIGQVSKALAKKLTAKNAEFANDVIRAGKDAQKIIRAYLKNTPKRHRDPAELSQLLMKQDIDLSVKLPDTEVVNKAREIALQDLGGLTGTVIQFPQVENF